MTKCWNRIDQRPTFRYCLEILQQLHERKNIYAQIDAEFPHDVPYKYVNSDDSSIINEKLPINETSIDLIHQELPTIPKYLELMYDENPEVPLNCCEHHESDVKDVSYRKCQNLSNVLHDDGYEIPVSLNHTLDINGQNGLNISFTKTRTLSNSSTVSNKSEQYPILLDSLPENYKQSSLILDEDHKIYPATKIITRQSGWV